MAGGHHPSGCCVQTIRNRSVLSCSGEAWASSAGLRKRTWIKIADQASILWAYRDEIERVQRAGGYATVDAIRMTPDHPERALLRRRFLAKHTHAEAEVLLTRCQRGDLISVTAGTRHWFNISEGWLAKFTGSDISWSFPGLD